VKRSAGLLLWRRAGRAPNSKDAIEVLLAHPGGPLFVRKDDAHWSIPKGECDPGEDEWVAAQREFSEELGIPVPPGTPAALGEARQGSGKVNVIWALEADPGPFEVRSNLFDMQWPPRSGKWARFPEVDRVAWFPLDVAQAKLFRPQRPFIDRLAASVEVRRVDGDAPGGPAG
jgi:predicted NUDIX family NTP pyrophosphohydrolase